MKNTKFSEEQREDFALPVGYFRAERRPWHYLLLSKGYVRGSFSYYLFEKLTRTTVL